MKFLVSFERPGWYQADHPKAKRSILQLVVHAPDERSAEIHVLRTVQGDLGQLTTQLAATPLVDPLVESFTDVRQEYLLNEQTTRR